MLPCFCRVSGIEGACSGQVCHDGCDMTGSFFVNRGVIPYLASDTTLGDNCLAHFRYHPTQENHDDVGVAKGTVFSEVRPGAGFNNRLLFR